MSNRNLEIVSMWQVIFSQCSYKARTGVCVCAPAHLDLRSPWPTCWPCAGVQSVNSWTPPSSVENNRADVATIHQDLRCSSFLLLVPWWWLLIRSGSCNSRSSRWAQGIYRRLHADAQTDFWSQDSQNHLVTTDLNQYRLTLWICFRSSVWI